MSVLTDPLWLALSPERRETLLEKHRYVNVEHGFEWWDSIFEQFVEDLTQIGIEVETRPIRTTKGTTRYEPEIFFTGFSSQGDGACFSGHVSDWTKLLTAMGEERFIKDVTDWRFRCRSGGRYCHSGTMDFDGDLFLEENPYDPEDELLQHEAWALTHTKESEVDALWDRLEKKFKALADNLYKCLEEEYDYLTSDEVVIEYILEHAADELTEEEDETADEILSP